MTIFDPFENGFKFEILWQRAKMKMTNYDLGVLHNDPLMNMKGKYLTNSLHESMNLYLVIGCLPQTLELE